MKRMIKFAFTVLALVALVVMIPACASQATYDRVTSEDCLVLIPTEIVSTDGLNLTRDYYLHFSDGQAKRKISKVKNDLIPVLIQSDGVSITMVSSSVSSGGQHNVVGGTYECPVDLKLPYDPGKVIVYEYSFLQSYAKVDGSSFQSRWGFNKTPGDKMEFHMSEFLSRPEAQSWKD